MLAAAVDWPGLLIAAIAAVVLVLERLILWRLHVSTQELLDEIRRRRQRGRRRASDDSKSRRR